MKIPLIQILFIATLGLSQLSPGQPAKKDTPDTSPAAPGPGAGYRISGNGALGGADSGKPSMKGEEHAALFHSLDANGDGQLSREEFMKLSSLALATVPASKEARSELFHKLDTDGDGKLSLEEFEKISAVLKGTSGQAPKGR